jgi:hypothetical protein
MEAANQIARLPRQTVIRNLAALRPRRSWSASRARAGPTEALPQSDKVLRKGERFLPVLPAGDRENRFTPEYPLRGVRRGRRISGL